MSGSLIDGFGEVVTQDEIINAWQDTPSNAPVQHNIDEFGMSDVERPPLFDQVNETLEFTDNDLAICLEDMADMERAYPSQYERTIGDCPESDQHTGNVRTDVPKHVAQSVTPSPCHTTELLCELLEAFDRDHGFHQDNIES